MTSYVKKIEVPSKVVYYKSDGTGRDTYIKTINGGLLTQDRLHALIPKPIPETEPMQFQKKKYHRTIPPKLPNKFPNYISDGSGRDYYVCVNNGGTNDTSYHWRNQVDFKFNAELRQYPTITSQAQRDMWIDLQQGFRNQKNQRQLSTEKSVAKTQMGLTMRLSTPTNRAARTMSQSRPQSAGLSQSASQCRRNSAIRIPEGAAEALAVHVDENSSSVVAGSVANVGDVESVSKKSCPSKTKCITFASSLSSSSGVSD